MLDVWANFGMMTPILVGRRIAPDRNVRGGKSEHRRVRCRITSGYMREEWPRGVPTESATENIPPGSQDPSKGEKVE